MSHELTEAFVISDSTPWFAMKPDNEIMDKGSVVTANKKAYLVMEFLIRPTQKET